MTGHLRQLLRCSDRSFETAVEVCSDRSCEAYFMQEGGGAMAADRRLSMDLYLMHRQQRAM